MAKHVNIVFVIGAAGVGKSAVGKLIANHKNFVYVDKETVTCPFTELYLKECSPTNDPYDRESDFYMDNVRPIEYQTMLRIALENIELGNDVVLSAPFEKELNDENWINEGLMAKILEKANLKIIRVHVDKQTMLNRLISRNELRDSWKLSNWDTYIASMADLNVAWNKHAYDEYTFDNSDALPILYDIQVKSLIKWFDQFIKVLY
ncbi:AAA family ATPase [Viridibacillus sp. YIM B01967]|uniref:AAA family ATPase n=1 Tax=Viridibacillus soli TaxID=2798301 RepID=A0ABS1H2M4_9BACL|nr:AAA family ATPase [Viridibacillus soli]MBK3493658.1 AAA family ATPase [Viridibacillus soli]